MHARLSFLLILLLSGAALKGQGIDFFHGSWAEALEKAKSEQKLIFVDAYAVWCGPCKRMAANVFPDPKVGEFFNANFVCMKIDMEKTENAEFASKYPVSAYPTLIFIDKDGKITLKQVGAQQVEGLLELGKKALGAMDKIEDMDAAYAEGNRDPKFLFDYVKALNRAAKPSLKITNEYLATQKDLSTEFNRRFLYEGATESDSRVFDLLLQQRAGVAALFGQEALDNRIEQACRKTVKKAIEFRSETLLAEAKEKMKAGRPTRAESFNFEADMAYFSAVKDSKKYLKAAAGFQKSTVKNSAAGLHRLVQEMLRAFPDDANLLSQAAGYEKTAAENGGLPEYYLTLADIYKRQGKREDALKTARKGLEVIGDKPDGSKMMLENFIKGLQ